MLRQFFFLFFLPLELRPNAGHGLLILKVSRSHTTTHHSRQDSSGRVISSSQRPLPDNTQHSQQKNIHAPGGIRTHDLSRRAAADPRLRPCGYRERKFVFLRRRNPSPVLHIRDSQIVFPVPCGPTNPYKQVCNIVIGFYYNT